MINTSIRIEEEIFEKIKFISKNSGKKQTEIMRDFLSEKTEIEFEHMIKRIEFGNETEQILADIENGKKTFTHKDFLAL